MQEGKGALAISASTSHFTLKIEAARSSETLLSNHHAARRNNSENHE